MGSFGVTDWGRGGAQSDLETPMGPQCPPPQYILRPPLGAQGALWRIAASVHRRAPFVFLYGMQRNHWGLLGSLMTLRSLRTHGWGQQWGRRTVTAIGLMWGSLWGGHKAAMGHCMALWGSYGTQ